MTAHTALDVYRRSDLGDRYMVLLAFVLLGYAICGKGFAYLGAPPLFIGEISLALGLLVLLGTRCIFAVLTPLTCLLLAALMGWVVVRTIPYVGVHRVDALRDSVIVVYGCFAFITIGLLVEKPARIIHVVRYFSVFTRLFVPLGPALYLVQKLAANVIPLTPGADTPLVNIRTGEVAVHLGGAAAFALLGLRRVSSLWVGLLLIGIAIIAAQSRGGTLAILSSVMLALVLGGKARTMVRLALGFVVVLGTGYLFNIEIAIPGDERTVSARQIVDNFVSIFFESEDAQLDGTKQFRVDWWHYIRSYTLYGDYFWTGKGFGVNLAQVDGFVVGSDTSPLRAPHSAHMTILARSGVPGLVLWTLTLASLFSALLWNSFVARRRSDDDWANLFLFFACYLLALLVDASFDVALEGPMLGIWFWVLFGLGIGSTMIYRAMTLQSDRSPS